MCSLWVAASVRCRRGLGTMTTTQLPTMEIAWRLRFRPRAAQESPHGGHDTVVGRCATSAAVEPPPTSAGGHWSRANLPLRCCPPVTRKRTATVLAGRPTAPRLRCRAGSADHFHAVEPGDGEAIWFLRTLMTVKASGAESGGGFSLIEVHYPPGFARRCMFIMMKTSPSTSWKARQPSSAVTALGSLSPERSWCCRVASATGSRSVTRSRQRCCRCRRRLAWSASSATPVARRLGMSFRQRNRPMSFGFVPVPSDMASSCLGRQASERPSAGVGGHAPRPEIRRLFSVTGRCPPRPVKTGERMFLWCTGGPAVGRAAQFAPPSEIAVDGGIYVLVDDGSPEYWRYEFVAAAR